jgi:hypothetical protein
MRVCTSSPAAGTAYFAIGLALFAVGLAGQDGFLGVGIAFLALGTGLRCKRNAPR